MTERPILFKAPMVRAILAGTKTQTRRAWKMPRGCEWYGELGGEREGWFIDPGQPWWLHVGECRCPYGREGDLLWVREAFAGSIAYERHRYPLKEWGNKIWYIADGEPRSGQWTLPRPSIHMPRALSRITLEVTGVRVERLQDISEADAQAEGIERSGECNWRDYLDSYNDFTSARRSYRSLWESINGPGSWDVNPWVWCVEFRRIDAARQSNGA